MAKERIWAGGQECGLQIPLRELRQLTDRIDAPVKCDQVAALQQPYEKPIASNCSTEITPHCSRAVPISRLARAFCSI
jgi:hypothetical protein